MKEHNQAHTEEAAKPAPGYGTDEPHAGPVKRGRDMDTLMLFGCSGFVVVAICSWALAVWPHFLLTETYRLQTLELCLAAGLIPAAVLGAVVTRLFGLPAAAGFLGGSICSGTFLYLRIQQVMAFRGVPEAPQPDYPAAWMWLVPLGWIVVSLILIALLLKPSEYALETRRPGKDAPESSNDGRGT